jgi:transposase-like protein
MSHNESKQTNANDDRDVQVPEPEVLPRAKRRRFLAEYKLRILEEADKCTKRGEIGAILRREGLYSSHLSTWRQQRLLGQLEGLSPKKRGREPQDLVDEEVARLRRENERLRARLEEAEMIIDVQKKLSQLLGLTPDETETDESA